MRREATFGALLLIAVGIVLGATVFRSDIAQATGLAQSVTVANTAAQAVPVREQNLDGNGNIKVHEQGTANVQVTNAVTAASVPATQFLEGGTLLIGGRVSGCVASHPVLVSSLTLTSFSGNTELTFRHPGDSSCTDTGPETYAVYVGSGQTVSVTLPNPVYTGYWTIGGTLGSNCTCAFTATGVDAS